MAHFGRPTATQRFSMSTTSLIYTSKTSDRCGNANGKVLVKCVGENLLPTARPLGHWRLGPPVAAPGTGTRHTDMQTDAPRIRMPGNPDGIYGIGLGGGSGI